MKPMQIIDKLELDKEPSSLLEICDASDVFLGLEGLMRLNASLDEWLMSDDVLSSYRVAVRIKDTDPIADGRLFLGKFLQFVELLGNNMCFDLDPVVSDKIGLG